MNIVSIAVAFGIWLSATTCELSEDELENFSSTRPKVPSIDLCDITSMSTTADLGKNVYSAQFNGANVAVKKIRLADARSLHEPEEVSKYHDDVFACVMGSYGRYLRHGAQQ